MIYVVDYEPVPESHSLGLSASRIGVIAGFALMMALDNAFG